MKGLTISEAARAAGVNLETIRYYERRGLLSQPPRRPSGYRIYGEEAVRQIRFIKRAQKLGFTLNEIRELLELHVDQAVRCGDVRARADAKIAAIDVKIEQLRSMRAALERLVAACASRNASDECPILHSLADDENNCECEPARSRTIK